MSLIFILLLLAIPQQHDTTVPDAIRTFVPGIVAPTTLPTDAMIVRAIKALEARGVPVTDDRAAQYAKFILAAARRHGIDPYLLVAVARVESNFTPAVRPDFRCKTPGYQYCSQDCGVTQQNFSGRPKWVLARCKQVQQDPAESFMLAADELAKHAVWCREKIHLDSTPERCILNRYNGGPYYRRVEQCRKMGCDALPLERQGRCRFSQRRCMVTATYWTKVMCYQEAARTATTPTKNCHWCWSVDDIPSHFSQGIQGNAGSKAIR